MPISPVLTPQLNVRPEMPELPHLQWSGTESESFTRISAPLHIFPATDLAAGDEVDKVHRFRLRDALIPAGIVAVCTYAAKNTWLTNRRWDFQNIFSNKGHHKTEIDNYLQYAPAAAVMALNWCGVKGKHGWVDRTILMAMSWATMGIIINSLKYTIKEERPDSSTHNSFPSGHTATAFMGAEILRKEYADVSPVIAWSGYAMGAVVGYLRIYNNRHYINDVLAGAAIGIFSTNLAYWLYPKIFRKSKCHRDINITAAPFYSRYDGCSSVGASMSLVF